MSREWLGWRAERRRKALIKNGVGNGMKAIHQPLGSIPGWGTGPVARCHVCDEGTASVDPSGRPMHTRHATPETDGDLKEIWADVIRGRHPEASYLDDADLALSLSHGMSSDWPTGSLDRARGDILSLASSEPDDIATARSLLDVIGMFVHADVEWLQSLVVGYEELRPEQRRRWQKDDKRGRRHRRLRDIKTLVDNDEWNPHEDSVTARPSLGDGAQGPDEDLGAGHIG